MPRIIDPEHFEEAEKIVNCQLRRLGWYYVEDDGYHIHFSELFCGLISKIYSPTSLYVRTSPDKIAVNTNIQSVILVEVKDLLNPEYSNVAIEAFPFLIHKYLATYFDIQILYAFCAVEETRACWVQNLPIWKAIIPARKDKDSYYWQPLIENNLPNTFCEIKPTYGSNDPFLLIKGDDFEQLQNIEYLLRAEINAKRR